MGHHLSPQKPHTGRLLSDLRKLMNGILYVVTTGCNLRCSRQYGSKSTVHRFHLYLCEHDTYQEILNEFLNKGYDSKKTDTKDIPAKKRGNNGHDDYKKVKGVRLSALVDLQELPLSVIVVPANQNNPTFYIPILKNFKIKRFKGRSVNMPLKVTADAIYDTDDIRKYNRRRRIKSNISVKIKNRKKKERKTNKGRLGRTQKEKYNRKVL